MASDVWGIDDGYWDIDPCRIHQDVDATERSDGTFNSVHNVVVVRQISW